MGLGVVPVSADRLAQPAWPDAKPWVRVLAGLQDVVSALSAAGASALADRVRTLAGADDQVILLLSRDRGSLQLLVGGRLVPLDAVARDALLGLVQVGPRSADGPVASAVSANAAALMDPAREADVQAQIRDGLGVGPSPAQIQSVGDELLLAGAISLPGGVSPNETARLLSAAFAQSGLFLESHVAQWFLGKRSLQQIREDLANLPGAFVCGDGAERRSALQFAAMQQQGVGLEGVAWGWAPFRLKLSWQDEDRGAEAGTTPQPLLVTAELILQLPCLGSMRILVRACEDLVGIQIGGDECVRISSKLPDLERAVRSHGIDLVQISLDNGA